MSVRLHVEHEVERPAIVDFQGSTRRRSVSASVSVSCHPGDVDVALRLLDEAHERARRDLEEAR